MIALNSTGPGGEPSLAINRFGTIVLGWMNWAGPLLRTPPGINEYSVSTDHGASFGPARALPVSVQRYESDVSIASGGANGTFWIGYQSQPTSCSFYSSGVMVTQAWNNASNLSDPALTMGCASGKYYDREWLGATPNGTLYQVADVPVGLPQPDLFVARSFDGIRFQSPQLVSNDSYISVGTRAYNDSLWVIGDTSFPAKRCTLYLSTDGGGAWRSVPAPLPSDCASAVDPAAGIQGTEWQLGWGSGAALFAVYVNASGVEMTRSTDLGATWSPPELISGVVPAGTAFQTPTIASDPSTGEVAVAWLDTRSGNGSWSVYLSSSRDNGARWGGALQVSDGTVGTGPRFWPGDFIGSALTPWGTDAVSWSGNNSTGQLTPYFTQVPIATYPVTFAERGLPSGTPWSVMLNGLTENSTTPSIVFAVPNGTYPFTVGTSAAYRASPSFGSVVVSGAATTNSVTFTASAVATYPVTFLEAGLPFGAIWNVTLNGTPEDSSTALVGFVEPNGTYPFVTGTVAGYSANLSDGSVTVRGAAVSEGITFTPLPVHYGVTFTETGLPGGSTWTVTVGDRPRSTADSTIVFNETNGTYPFTIGAVAGYSANRTSGEVRVDGNAVSEGVTFRGTPAPGPGGTNLGLSEVESLALVGTGGAVLLAGLGVSLLARRRRRADSTPEPPKVP